MKPKIIHVTSRFMSFNHTDIDPDHKTYLCGVLPLVAMILSLPKGSWPEGITFGGGRILSGAPIHEGGHLVTARQLCTLLSLLGIDSSLHEDSLASALLSFGLEPTPIRAKYYFDLTSFIPESGQFTTGPLQVSIENGATQ
jgi:hypothetical protein